MQKKLLVLAIAAIIVTFCACQWELPTAIEIRAKPQLDLPIDSEKANLSQMLYDNIKNAMGSSEEIIILNYVGKPIQTFLIDYAIQPQGDDLSLDFSQQLNLVDDLSIDTDDLNMEIDADDLTDFANMDIEPIKIAVDLDGLFLEIENRINTRFGATAGNNLLAMDLPIVGGGVTSATPTSFGGDTISFTAIMDEAHFHKGKLIVEIRLEESNLTPSTFSGANIKFTNIAILDQGSLILGKSGDISEPDSVTLTASSPAAYIEFDLANKVIDGNFKMQIGSYTDNSTVPGLVKLVLHPALVHGLEFKSITGLTMSEFEVVKEASDGIDLNIDDTFFIHAEIGAGALTFNIMDDPLSFTHEGFVFDYEIKFAQNNYLYKGTTYAGLNGTFTDTNTTLAGKHIVSGEDIEVEAGSKFTLKTPAVGGASFWIHDDCLDSGKITFSVTPKLQIDWFKVVHVDITDQLDKLEPDIPPISLDEAADYLKWINFTEVGPIVTFGAVTVDGLTFMISEPQLGVNPSKIFYPIVANTTLEDFVNKDANNKIYLQSDAALAAGKPQVTELNFDIEVGTASGTGGVIAISNLNPADPNIQLKVDEIIFKSEWDKMMIDVDNFGAFEGTFPDKNADPIDLSNLGDFLDGFEFTAIESFLYISGPEIFFSDLKPEITINVSYTKNNVPYTQDIISVGASHTLKNAAGQLNLDPSNTGKFSGELPGEDKGQIKLELEEILNDHPTDLRFTYDVTLTELEIRKADLISGNKSEPLKMDILIVFPLALQASAPNGATISLSDLTSKKEENDEDDSSTKKQKDLLGRTANGNSSWLGYIKSLSLELELNGNVFEGGYLYLDDTKNKTDGRRIQLPLHSNALGLSIEGENLEYINNTVPWDPDIGIYFAPGDTLSIPPNLGVVKIKFNADIRAKIDLTGSDK